ncbi:TlpA family protein disulfide reductase [Lacinutrix sp. C3R15]|uniref:TlpA family protein disulfide reductase n=1 Tax=Flavobacteriaceae TaxID=49546 RepID=UPI001C09172D|nr:MULTISPECIES: TlpA family protein disulfide reductase [Flavobacteriaceae]MBU2939690.1 TlpA family protein disulfide reductase [Lacinutrix sp. C3R15]MDO6623005.1 TlpA family protein disulfide reductase [Oceanihabitans sp. 1_MG-2023]
MNIRVLFIVFVLFLNCKNENKPQEITSTKEKEYVLEDKPIVEEYDFNAFEKFLNIKDDKVYVVNFWATWCAPCIKELPYFEAIHENYKNKNVVVLLVSLDFPKQYQKKLIPFMQKHKLKSKVVALNDPDSNSWIPKVSEEWSGAIPATLIYNKEKRAFYEQSFNYEELKTEVNRFIN